jgi:hypothetical protein
LGLKRAADPPVGSRAKPVNEALCLTPAEIMAAVEIERSDPKRQAEIEHYKNLFRDGSVR